MRFISAAVETTVGIAHAEAEFNNALNALLERNVSAEDSALLFRETACCNVTV